MKQPVRIVVLLGPPGAGKGTVASRLAVLLDYRHLSSGDLLRSAVSEGGALGVQAAGYMRRGELVPDALVAKIVGEKIRSESRDGILLDGFPRTPEQVDILDRELENVSACLQAAVLFVVPDDVLFDRLTGRRICPACAAVYHVRTLRPRVEGRCDQCGSMLERRDDDAEDTVRHRLDVYDRQTAPLLAAYENRGVLVRVDAVGDLAAIVARVRAVLAKTAHRVDGWVRSGAE